MSLRFLVDFLDEREFQEDGHDPAWQNSLDWSVRRSASSVARQSARPIGPRNVLMPPSS